MDVYEATVMQCGPSAWDYVVTLNGSPVALGGGFDSEDEARDACAAALFDLCPGPLSVAA